MESKKVEFFNKLSFITLLLTLFSCLFFFIPYNPITLEASKGFLLSIGAVLSLFFWLISRLGDGKFLIPKDKLILFASFIPLVFLVSSLFSSSLYVSLLGSGFEIGTFGSMLVLFIIFFLSSIHFQSEKRLWYFIKLLFIGGAILIVFQFISLFVNFNNILPGFFQGISSGNLVGSWNTFAFMLGIIVLLSLFTTELLKTKLIFRIGQYLLLSLGMVLLIVINSPFVWLLICSFSIIIFVYSIFIQRSSAKIVRIEDKKKKFPFASLIIVFISFILLISSNIIGNFISSYINVDNTNIRPSIVTTSKIAFESIKHDPLFGTGPNTFAMDWVLWQPKDIAQTIFWNTDFSNGFSLLFTFAVTTGLLGLISLLLFLVVYIVRSIQSIHIALQNTLSNYFIITILMVSLYSWITIIFYNPNIIMLMLAFTTSGILIGVLVYKKAILVKSFSFLSDPRHSFFSILGIVVLMISTIFLTYVYIEKFTSIIYFSKGLTSGGNTIESLSKSERMFLKAISLDKNDVYYRSLSQLYLNEIDFILNSNEEIGEDTLKSNLQQLINNAEEKAQLAVNRNPKQYLNYMNLGNVYSALIPLSVSGSYESAVVAYDRALELAPNNPSIFLSRALLEFINKNNSEARNFIKQALNLKFNYVDAIFLLVQIETSEDNLSEAIRQAQYASEIVPSDPTIFFRLGLLRFNNNDYTGAISAFEKAVILDNNYFNARYFLGQSYKKVGRSSDALVQFNILSQIFPDNQDVKKAINEINKPTQENNDTKKSLPDKN